MSKQPHVTTFSPLADLNSLQGTISMRELLERERALEEEAEANLQENWGDEDACTYDQGYITQPIYACGTCMAQGQRETFGFCFGCSMNCHVDHDVYELFDKRHFKCDCGTPKSGCACKFSEAPRTQNNEENKYTHNFQSKYCWCDSAYDPDVDIMSQCVVCEDWFHHTCVARRTTIPDLNSFKGFLCHTCGAKHPFFLRYPQLQPPSTSPFLPGHHPTTTTSSTTTSSNTTPANTTSSTTSSTLENTTNHSTTATSSESTPTAATSSSESTSTTATSSSESTPTSDTSSSVTEESTTEEKKPNTATTPNTNTSNENTTTEKEAKTENGKGGEKDEPQTCILEQTPAPPTPSPFPDLFLIPGWRKGICKCTSCAAMYRSENLEFLLDDADDPDVEEEEVEGEGAEREGAPEPAAAVDGKGESKKRKISMLESAEKAFLEDPQIPHNNKLNLITGYSDLAGELKEFLREFAESGKVVTQADIAEFFEELRKKRQRR